MTILHECSSAGAVLCLSPPYSVAPSGGGVALLLGGGVVHLVVLHGGVADEVDLDVRAEDCAQIFSDVARYSRVVDLARGKSGRRFGTESRKDRSFWRAAAFFEPLWIPLRQRFVLVDHDNIRVERMFEIDSQPIGVTD